MNMEINMDGRKERCGAKKDVRLALFIPLRRLCVTELSKYSHDSQTKQVHNNSQESSPPDAQGS